MKEARKAPQIGLRLPPELKEWLEKQAEASRRSLNGEILYRLERQMETEGEKSPA